MTVGTLNKYIYKINVLASSFRFIWIPILWVHGHTHILNLSVGGGGGGLATLHVRIWRLWSSESDFCRRSTQERVKSNFSWFRPLYQTMSEYNVVPFPHFSIGPITTRGPTHYLGPHAKAPILGFKGEMGWMLPKYTHFLSMFKLWNIYCMASNYRITRKVLLSDYKQSINSWSHEWKLNFQYIRCG